MRNGVSVLKNTVRRLHPYSLVLKGTFEDENDVRDITTPHFWIVSMNPGITTTERKARV